MTKSSVAGITTRSFSYDAAGNTVTDVRGKETLSFVYNVRNRPVTVTRSGISATRTSSYVFNVLEQMVQRSTNAPGGPAGTVHYVYGLDGALLAEADGATGTTLRDYIWLPVDDVSPAADNDNEEGAQTSPLPLGLVTGVNTPTPALLMVHADHLGRPLRLTDPARATVWSAAYDPFGQAWQITGPVEQNLRFPGQYFLLESGLSYNWHRVYDASTGRYTQPDPLRFVDGPSVYGYVRASPMMRVDRFGLQQLMPVPPIFSRPPAVIRPPLERFPTNPAKPPGPGWEWKGPGEPGGKRGGWNHPELGKLHPDLSHPPGIGPHWDWKAPGGGWFRWFPDGRVEPKAVPVPERLPGGLGCWASLTP